MNIPNTLTLIRIILVPVFVILLMQGSFSYALLVFVIAGVTDGLDGFLARILKQQTVLGSYLDPLADKALIVTAFVALSILDIIPGWLTVIVISRDCIILLGVSVLSLMSVSFEIRPAYVSKATTVLQLLTVFLVLMSMIMPGYINHIMIVRLFWITAFFTVVSGLNYIFKGIKIINNS
ncbi:MAG: CDP-diacylglycerol--glycerol-3-phosphate 3-phosphatidyltransferase [Deltaproteobacteria bacterium]|nr:CDP-diacylglycerol--glycerol-3-phosphate 3-phosphatidyltransferase [Deltaproteobacteria bacterium]MBW2594660.1 CDP-diacylglycerol--glycerol-3-phosphate 3-phosphatidyltransferase [Deltaproteobacteria bacterium]MBW2649753.1 CDP-diacylglycerol--glycerol-3-phosphate 3-phosphatidyltransferase [Deltaproteobacteria bacterium]